MLRAVVVAALALAPATAAAQTNDVKLLERWVGTWSGKVTAKGCGDDGSRAVSLSVAMVTGGGLRSSGDVLVDGLGDIDWTSNKKGLSAKTDGFTATLTGKGKVKLSLTTAGKCKIKATLARRTSKIASCDRLDVLADIKSQCGIAGDERAQIDVDFTGWRKLTGKAKKAQDKQCKAQVATLSTEVASCSAGGGVTLSADLATGIAACDEMLRRTLCMYDKTPGMPPDAKKAFLDAIPQWRDMAKNPDTRQALGDACTQATAAGDQGFKAVGC